MGFFDSEIGHRVQTIVESGGLDPTSDKSRDRRLTLFATPAIRLRVNRRMPVSATYSLLTVHPVCAQSLTPSGDAKARHLLMFMSSIIATVRGASATRALS
jgi:hypothetical protein